MCNSCNSLRHFCSKRLLAVGASVRFVKKPVRGSPAGERRRRESGGATNRHHHVPSCCSLTVNLHVTLFDHLTSVLNIVISALVKAVFFNLFAAAEP